MIIHITDDMIEKRRLENDRIAKARWREKNRQHVNDYHREWCRKYREKNGVSYSIAMKRRKAKAELLQENSSE